MKKKNAPETIDQDLFNTFSKKEQDFILMLHSRKYTKQQIMDHFYLETRQGYYRFNERIRLRIKNRVPLVT